MIPSSKWFPQSNSDRAVWFHNFAVQFDNLATHLGFLPADVTAVSADDAIMQFMLTACEDADNYASAARSYRKQITENGIGDPVPVFPVPPAFGPPAPVPTGVFERLDNLVKRIRVAPNYTNDDGVLLGIVPTSTGPTPEGDLKPVIKPEVMPGSVVNVKFVRGQTDGIALEMQLDNETAWTPAGNFFKSPAILDIETKADDLPRAVRLRARYLDGNNPVGQNSDTVSITTTP